MTVQDTISEEQERLDFLKGETAVEMVERIAKGNVHASSPADVPAMIAGLAHHIDAMRKEVAFQSNWTHQRHNGVYHVLKQKGGFEREPFPGELAGEQTKGTMQTRIGAADEETGMRLRISDARELIVEHQDTDGADHKQWLIDQVFRALCDAPDEYAILVAEARAGEDGPDSYSWDTGIAP